MTVPDAPRPQMTARGLAALLLTSFCLAAGYAGALHAATRLPWETALWQAAICLLAAPILLVAVIKTISLTKFLLPLRGAGLALAAALARGAQLLLPWLGWSALLWWMNQDRLQAGGALAVGALVAAFSYLMGIAIVIMLHPRPRDVQVVQLEVTIAGLPEPFDGYRILHLSDLHCGPFLPVGALKARLRPAASLDRDLVAFTGDLTDSGIERAEAVVTLLAGLQARDGTIAVLGNHDHWIGEERIAAALAKDGIGLLRNRHLAISRGGASLYFAGIEDASYTRNDDLPAALEGVPESAPVILLSHTPDIILKPGETRASLVLSGHTHGGQVVLPWVGPLHVPARLGRRFASGLHHRSGRWLFVNRGLGEVFPPIRINCPPEMALLTLRRVGSSH